jgi:prolyl 4-hydroxylase
MPGGVQRFPDLAIRSLGRVRVPRIMAMHKSHARECAPKVIASSTRTAHMLDPQWHQWIRENLDRGCTVESLVDAMTLRHVEPGLAIATIRRVMALAASAAVAAPASSLPSYWPPDFPFLGANAVRLDGREIRLLARMDTPAVAVLDGVLSDNECERLIDLSRSKLARSTVVDPERGAETITLERDSEGMYFQRGENPLVRMIEARLAQIMCSPVIHGEGLQVSHFGPGGEYRPHLDYFDPGLPGSAVHHSSSISTMSMRG